MPVPDDIAAARRLLRNAWRSRRARNRLAAIPGALLLPEPNSVRVAVYFADAPVNLYQLRQWYLPLVELSKTWPIVVICRSPSTMLRLLEECPLPLVYLRQIADLEHFVAEQNLAVVLYVNQNPRNFQMFRYGRMWHVFINHGESDKIYMTSNQYKAYDFSFVAGQAAKDRLRDALWDYDVDRRALPIGRPQADHFAGNVPYPPDDRIVVLYAPTWEGDRSSMSYGSVRSHGVAIVETLLADPRYRLIYRPHPRTGVIDGSYRQANASIVAALEHANNRDDHAHHIYDDGPAMGWQLAAADVAITDISAMVYDRLATGKPLLVTRPVSPEAEIDQSGYLGACEWLSADDTARVHDRIHSVMHSVAARDRLHFWVERHFGDTTHGAATARFEAAVTQLVDTWESYAGQRRGDVGVSEGDLVVSKKDGEN